jgi:tetratricopeptide (TPR) repeat protein
VTYALDGKSFLSTAEDGQTRSWSVPEPVEEDLSRLDLRVRIRAAQDMHAGQAVLQLSSKEWLELREQQPSQPDQTPLVSTVDWHDARAHDAEQLGNAYAALWHLDRIAEATPQNALVYLRRGRLHAAGSRLEEADADYRRALQHGSGSQLVDWDRLAAAQSEAIGQDAVALWYLDRAIAMTAAEADLFARRAALHARQKKLDAALTDWSRALKLRPREPSWYLQRSKLYGQLKKTKEQEADEAQAVASGVGLGDIWELAELRCRAGRWSEAADLFAAAYEAGRMPLVYSQHWGFALLKAQPADQTAYRELCTRVLQSSRSGYHLFDTERLTAFQPEVARWQCTISSRVPKAISDWTRLLDLSRQLAAAAAALPETNKGERQEWESAAGALLYRAGCDAEALTCLEASAAVKGVPGQRKTWLFLAMTHHHLGHAAEARRWLEKARGQPLDMSDAAFWDTVEIKLLLAEAGALIEARIMK